MRLLGRLRQWVIDHGVVTGPEARAQLPEGAPWLDPVPPACSGCAMCRWSAASLLVCAAERDEVDTCARLAAAALGRHGHTELADRAAWLADAQS